MGDENPGSLVVHILEPVQVCAGNPRQGSIIIVQMCVDERSVAFISLKNYSNN